MDTTKKYIEMCEKAGEIQKNWKPKEGDFYCYIDVMCGHPVYTVKYSHLNDVHKTDAMKGHKCPLCRYDYDTFQEILAVGREQYDGLTGWFVWLPRQDQLQEMILPVLKKKYQEKSPLPWGLNVSKLNKQANWMISLLKLFLERIKFDDFSGSNSMEQL